VDRQEPVVPEVRRAVPSDMADLVPMLVRAFDDDPVANFMFCNPKRRAKALGKFFSIQLQQEYLKAGDVWTTRERTGAAIWGPPTKPRPGLRELLHVFPLFRELFPLSHIRVALRALFVVESLRPKAPHWYLATLGTEPSLQGRGIGTALMKPVLDRADAVGEPAYLESSKERNVAFYSRFGFEVTRELRAVEGAPRIWLMWREPRPPESP
jgi:GNAT superfamily N-acetyltransferase